MITDPQVVKRRWTEEDLQALPSDGYIHEVVDGELIMSPKNNFEHEFICERLMFELSSFNRTHQLGVVLGSNAGFWMKNRNCRAPDISFIAAARIRQLGFTRGTRKFFPGAPDLAIEIVSTSNTPLDIHSRLVDFFESGCRLAWLIHPDEEFVELCHSPADRTLLAPGATLVGEDVLPGFQYNIANLFQRGFWEQ